MLQALSGEKNSPAKSALRPHGGAELRTKSYQEMEVAKTLREHQIEFSEFEPVFEQAFPDLSLQFNGWYKDAQFIKLMGEDRICNICAALVHAGAREAHRLWHRRLTLAIWSLQGTVLAELVKSGSLVVTDDGVKVKKKGKKSKK